MQDRERREGKTSQDILPVMRKWGNKIKELGKKRERARPERPCRTREKGRVSSGRKPMKRKDSEINERGNIEEWWTRKELVLKGRLPFPPHYVTKKTLGSSVS